VQKVFYKMADRHILPASINVISGQRAFGVEVVPLTKFGDPKSNRLATIKTQQTDQWRCS